MLVERSRQGFDWFVHEPDIVDRMLFEDLNYPMKVYFFEEDVVVLENEHEGLGALQHHVLYIFGEAVSLGSFDYCDAGVWAIFQAQVFFVDFVFLESLFWNDATFEFADRVLCHFGPVTDNGHGHSNKRRLFSNAGDGQVDNLSRRIGLNWRGRDDDDEVFGVYPLLLVHKRNIYWWCK